jgi:hypothetical protein
MAIGQNVYSSLSLTWWRSKSRRLSTPGTLHINFLGQATGLRNFETSRGHCKTKLIGTSTKTGWGTPRLCSSRICVASSIHSAAERRGHNIRPTLMKQEPRQMAVPLSWPPGAVPAANPHQGRTGTPPRTTARASMAGGDEGRDHHRDCRIDLRTLSGCSGYQPWNGWKAANNAMP